MMSADRLGDAGLMQTLKYYEVLFGGKFVWNNIVLVVPRQDYNETIHEDLDDWKKELKNTENLAC